MGRSAEAYQAHLERIAFEDYNSRLHEAEQHRVYELESELEETRRVSEAKDGMIGSLRDKLEVAREEILRLHKEIKLSKAFDSQFPSFPSIRREIDEGGF